MSEGIRIPLAVARKFEDAATPLFHLEHPPTRALFELGMRNRKARAGVAYSDSFGVALRDDAGKVAHYTRRGIGPKIGVTEFDTCWDLYQASHKILRYYRWMEELNPTVDEAEKTSLTSLLVVTGRYAAEIERCAKGLVVASGGSLTDAKAACVAVRRRAAMRVRQHFIAEHSSAIVRVPAPIAATAWLHDAPLEQASADQGFWGEIRKADQRCHTEARGPLVEFDLDDLAALYDFAGEEAAELRKSSDCEHKVLAAWQNLIVRIRTDYSEAIDLHTIQS